MSLPNDVPRENGQLSDRLKEKLALESLLDIEVLLRYRGVHTYRALESLETNERAVLLCKARELYELLGIFPSNLKKALDTLFGNEASAARQFEENDRMLSTNSRPLRPGCVSTSVPPASVFPLWAGAGGISSSWCSAGPRHPAVGPGPGATAELPTFAVDNTHLKRTVAIALEGARLIVGPERYAECVRRFRRSEELAVASCLEAAEMLAALGVRKEELRGDRDKKEAVKAAKKAARDVLLWRSCGCELGLDNKDAMIRCFEEACRHTCCDDNTVSQLTNGFRRIIEELAGQPQVTEQLIAIIARSPSRSTAPKKKGAKRGPGATELQADQALVAQPLAQVEPSSSSICDPFSMQSPVQLLAPGGPVRLPPGLAVQDHTYPLQGNRSFDKKTETSARSCSLRRRPSEATVRHQRPSPLPMSNATVVEEKAPDAASLEPPKVDGHLATVLVNAVIQELAQATNEHCVQCAKWLAWNMDFSVAGRDEVLVMQAQASLARAAQREGLDEKSLRQVMRCLARVAGSDLPCLEVFGAPSTDGDAADDARRGKQAALIPMLAETWAWLLVDGQDGQRLQLKVDTAMDDDTWRLNKLADCTMVFLQRCRKKEVARDCCSAMGALGQAAKNILPLVRRIAHWILETIEEFGGHPEVVQEGLGALLDVCKTRLLGLDLCRERAGHDEQQDTLVKHIQDGVMGMACTFEGRSELHMDIIVLAFRLLAHTHPLDQVVRYICGIKNRLPRELLFTVLDEIDSNLRPATQEWTKVATSRAGAATANVLEETVDGRNSWVLWQVQKHGGLGLKALKVLSPAVAAGALVEAWQGLDCPSVQLLVDWAKGSKPHQHQERFFLAGLLFDARALLPHLTLLSGSAELFGAGCGALLHLNCMEPLQLSLQRDVAHCFLRILAAFSVTFYFLGQFSDRFLLLFTVFGDIGYHFYFLERPKHMQGMQVPQVPSSCTAWVNVIGMSLWAQAEENSGVWRLAERAGWEVASTIRRGMGCEGSSAWSAVVRAALSVDLTSLAMNSELAAELKELA